MASTQQPGESPQYLPESSSAWIDRFFLGQEAQASAMQTGVTVRPVRLPDSQFVLPYSQITAAALWF